MTRGSKAGWGGVLLLSAVCLLSVCAGGPNPYGSAPDVDAAALQKEIVSKLSGGAEIKPGIRLADRAAPENKAEARTFLAGLWTRLGLDVQIQDYSAEGRNIFAVLPATAVCSEFVVVGAHYDSVRNSPGANDNATGVALATAAAAEMIRIRPRSRNLIFVLFDEEERGLRGSRAFARKLKDENTVLHSVHTIDQMGWDGDGDRAVELEIPYDGAEDLFSRVAKSFPVPLPVLTTPEAGSDHSAFRRLGFRAVGLTEEYRNRDTTPHIHRPSDTSDTVDFAYLKSTTALVVEVLRILVGSP